MKIVINDVTIEYDNCTVPGNTGAYVYHIIVDPDYRGQSRIRSAIEYLLKSYNSIYLDCWITLKSMYEHLGFKCIGQDYDEYYIMKLEKCDYKHKC